MPQEEVDAFVEDLDGTEDPRMASVLVDVDGTALTALERRLQALTGRRVTVPVNTYTPPSGGAPGRPDGHYRAPSPGRPTNARARGGPVYAGELYKVGEAGVEEFRPAVDGMIIPNHMLPSAAPSTSVRHGDTINQTFSTTVVDRTGDVLRDANVEQRKLARRVFA